MNPKNHPDAPHSSPQADARGIALLPDHAYSERFIELQLSARAHLEMSPPLSLLGNLPHITLVQGSFTDSANLPFLLQNASASISTNALTTVTPTRIVYKPRGWIFLEVEKSPALNAVHRLVADIAAPFLIPPTDLAKIADYSEGEKASYRAFGYRYMYDSFYPHLTLGRVPSEPTTQQMEHLNQRARELNLFAPFRVAQATVYAVGENGAHAQTILGCDL